MDVTLVTVILISIFFSALFSGLEIAFISSNKLQLELDRKQGLLSGRILSLFTQSPSRFIGTTLVGNNIALVIYGIFMAKLLEPVIRQALPTYLNSEIFVFVIQTVLATILILVTAEFTPKSIFLINPNLMLRFFSIPFLLIYYLLYPVVMAIVGLSKFFIVYVLKREYSEARPIFGLTDLNNYIKTHLTVQTDEDKDEVNARIIHNALEFKKVKIRDCMIPRTEIAAVDIEDGMEALGESFIKSGHSKILVYRESIDDIIGYTHSLELFKKPKSIDAILTPIIIVPETELANELLIQFITEHKSIALVVDEFGGTSGIVTMEDIIEEIFGEIQDEHDVEELVEVALNDRTWLMSARLEIDYLNEKYGWDIPDGEYETLGGYILNITEDIPGEKEIIEAGHFLISIESIHDTRIDTVKVERRGESESE